MSRSKPAFKKNALLHTAEFQRKLRHWFTEHGRQFPWTLTHDPYEILVSEIMLQQTQVSTVLSKGYYTNFLEKFPNISILAKSSDEDLLKAWEGLGYYRRARMLRQAAISLEENWDGAFPRHFHDLLSLPGIGHYTASALTAFAFHQVSPLMDGNVARILARVFDDHRIIEKAAVIRDFQEKSAQLCDSEDPKNHHYAMMQLGQILCRPTLPDCENCPISSFCKTRKPENLPQKKPRAKITELRENAIFLRDPEGRILLHRETGKRRTGFWRFPLRSDESLKSHQPSFTIPYTITRYKVHLHIYEIQQSTSHPLEAGDQWIDEAKIDSLPIPAPYRKALKKILENHEP